MNNFEKIKRRAIELLQTGIDGRTFDDLRNGESCVRTWAIFQALTMAIDEVRSTPLPRHRRAVLLKGEFNRAVVEIRQWILAKDRAA